MRGLLWLFSAVLLLGSTDGNQKIVDKAIDLANRDHGRNKPFVFFSINDRVSSEHMVHVILRSTCDNRKVKKDQKDCRPWVSCIACGDEMECVRRKDHNKIQKLFNSCKHHHIGGGHILALKDGNKQEHGCLGCI